MIGFILKFDVIITYINFIIYVIKSPYSFFKRMVIKKPKIEKKFRIEKDIGYKIFDKDELFHVDELLQELIPFIEKKIKNLNHDEIKLLASQKKIKPYYLNILEKDDLCNLSVLKKSINNKNLKNVLINYYGLIPQLSHIAIFYSNNIFTKENYEISGTQYAHFDNHDTKHIKLFLNLSDVTLNDGPLCIYDKNTSSKFRYFTKRVLRKRPVRNDNELNNIEKPVIPLIGKKGTMAIVDTANCLHYGSRVSKGERITLVLHFTTFSDYSSTVTKKYQDFNVAPHYSLRKELWPIGY